MNADPILVKATRLAHRGRYAEVIRLLEPEVVRFHDSFRYYYLLALSCLLSGDAGGALTYFRRAREIKMRDPGVLLGLGVLHLRRGETDRALDLYLEVLDKDPGNRRAVRALNIIRKYGDPDALSAWLESGRLKRLYPPLPANTISVKRIIFVPILTLIICGGLFSSLVYFRVLPSPFPKAPARPGLAAAELVASERSNPVQIGGSYHFVLTRSEILAAYDAAQRLFRDYRDEYAKVELNRILESNASEQIKAKARLLASYAIQPGFDTLRDRFSYAEVEKEPLLYRDCHVVWRGMAANLRIGEKTTSFDLLVGYDTRSSLEGIVPVNFDFAVEVDQERPLEVLGRVLPTFTGTTGETIRLIGVALHQSTSLETGKK